MQIRERIDELTEKAVYVKELLKQGSACGAVPYTEQLESVLRDALQNYTSEKQGLQYILTHS